MERSKTIHDRDHRFLLKKAVSGDNLIEANL
jgi:hypothetical protein